MDKQFKTTPFSILCYKCTVDIDSCVAGNDIEKISKTKRNQRW